MREFTVGELKKALEGFPEDTPVGVETYMPGTENDNGSFRVTWVEGQIDGHDEKSVVIWGSRRPHTLYGHEQPCAHCGKLTDALAGNPHDWPIVMIDPTQPGKTVFWRRGCVMNDMMTYAKEHQLKAAHDAKRKARLASEDKGIEVPVWAKKGGMIVRRDALEGDDPDHIYNYMQNQLGISRPEEYGIARPEVKRCPNCNISLLK